MYITLSLTFACVVKNLFFILWTAPHWMERKSLLLATVDQRSFMADFLKRAYQPLVLKMGQLSAEVQQIHFLRHLKVQLLE